MRQLWILGAVAAVCAAGPASLSADEKAPAAEQGADAEPVRLSMEECVRRAVANSRTLMAERHRVAAMDAMVEQVFWAPFSGFSATVAGTMVPDKCIDKDHFDTYGSVVDCDGSASSQDDNMFQSDFWTGGWGPSVRVEIEGGVPIYTFGKISNSKRAVEEARDAKKAEYPKFEHKIKFQVMQAYQAVSGAREMLYTIEQGRKHLKKARDKVEKDLENQEGTSTEIDLIKLKVFENEVDQYEAQSKEIERVGLAALRFLVGGADRDRVDILDEPQKRFQENLLPLEAYKKDAMKNRPELDALKHAVKAMESKVDMRRADLWPDLLVIGGFRYAWTPGRDDVSNWTLKDNYNYGPAVWLALAVNYKFDWGLDIYKLDEAKAELTALTIDQKETLEGVVLEVEKAYHKAVASKDALESMEKSRALVKGWIAAEVQNHETGLSSAKDVKEALAEYFKVMASIHKLTNDYNVSVAEIHRVTGKFEQAK
jgi:outer membrane protein TolC